MSLRSSGRRAALGIAALVAALLAGAMLPSSALAAGIRAVSNDGLGLAQQPGNPKLVTRGFVGNAGRSSDSRRP